MKEVTAAGGVLFRVANEKKDPEILLMFRRGVWDLPKGKLEPGESISECARREVSEEVGSSMPDIHEKLSNTYHEYDEDNELIGKTTHWYVMELGNSYEQLEPEKREGIEQLEWLPSEEAKQRVGYENLVSVIRDFQKWYSDKKINN
ncbi:MAG: NUDIX hydrolase [Candidatus Halalkalibacterium sp. M3_1C_030]